MKTSYILKHLFGTFIFFVILFISAGRIDYWQGIIYVIIGLIISILSYTILKPDPELLTERPKPDGIKKWDKNRTNFFQVLSGYKPTGIIQYVIPGFTVL